MTVTPTSTPMFWSLFCHWCQYKACWPYPPGKMTVTWRWPAHPLLHHCYVTYGAVNTPGFVWRFFILHVIIRFPSFTYVCKVLLTLSTKQMTLFTWRWLSVNPSCIPLLCHYYVTCVCKVMLTLSTRQMTLTLRWPLAMPPGPLASPW